MERGCRNCMWLYHMVTHNQTAPCSERLDYDKWQTAKSTNADRIRAMTDEELAEWLWFKVGKCPPFDVCPSQCIPCEAKDCWLDWLKQEAKDGD